MTNKSTNINKTIVSHLKSSNIKKRPRHMTLEIQDLD